MITLTLQGPFPSKKNAWRRGRGQRAYLPAQIQADIDALITQAQAAKNTDGARRDKIYELHGKKICVTAEFKVCDSLKDLDNVFTTVLDVLQKAGIIENDKYVRSFCVSEETGYGPGEERVDLTIKPI